MEAKVKVRFRSGSSNRSYLKFLKRCVYRLPTEQNTPPNADVRYSTPLHFFVQFTRRYLEQRGSLLERQYRSVFVHEMRFTSNSVSFKKTKESLTIQVLQGTAFRFFSSATKRIAKNQSNLLISVRWIDQLKSSANCLGP